MHSCSAILLPLRSRRRHLLLFAAVLSLVLGGQQTARAADAQRDLQGLGWDAAKLAEAVAYAMSLGSDSLMVVTDGVVVRSLGDLRTPYDIHSMRKAMLSALVGQHLGTGEHDIDLSANLEQLGVDDRPDPLTRLQRQATVLHLIKSTSGINHPAAADGGLTKEKDRRLGHGENQPGSVWAYNNWDYNALTRIFEQRSGLSVAEAFERGIAEPLGSQDFTRDSVFYRAEPARSLHRAAGFRMSARDLARFGQLYLDQGVWQSKRILPPKWVARITDDFTPTGGQGLRAGHGYLWWVAGPESGLPPGTFWA